MGAEFLTTLKQYPFETDSSFHNGKLKLKDDNQNYLTIDFADAFIFNNLTVSESKNNLEENSKHQYAIERVSSLTDTVKILSSKFPHIVSSSLNSVRNMILNACVDIKKRKDNPESVLYVEWCKDKNYVNIVSDYNCYIKVDLQDKRVFIIYSNKIATSSLYYLEESFPEAVTHLNTLIHNYFPEVTV